MILSCLTHCLVQKCSVFMGEIYLLSMHDNNFNFNLHIWEVVVVIPVIRLWNQKPGVKLHVSVSVAQQVSGELECDHVAL